jgi:hypothetical protein
MEVIARLVVDLAAMLAATSRMMAAAKMEPAAVGSEAGEGTARARRPRSWQPPARTGYPRPERR